MKRQVVVCILIAILIFVVFFVVEYDNFSQNIQEGRIFFAPSFDEKSRTCIPSAEICDGKDNDCDSQIDEGGVCEIKYSFEKLDIEDPLSEYKEPEFLGYIVQLQDDPIIRFKLNKDQNSLEKRSIDSYRESLIKKQNSVKSQINNILPESKIESSYKNVFNGFSIEDISEQESKQLESLPEVKKISPNYKVYTTLMDSVPLINADDVWQLQNYSGTNITGEGITIGIIDTGIAYYHGDLGGCFGEGCKVIGGYDFLDEDQFPQDDLGHGTHVASIAAGNGKEVANTFFYFDIYDYHDTDEVFVESITDVREGRGRVVFPFLSGDGGFFKYIGEGKQHGSVRGLLVTSNTDTLYFNASEGHEEFIVSYSGANISESYLLRLKFYPSNGGNETVVSVVSDYLGEEYCLFFEEGEQCSVGNNIVLTFHNLSQGNYGYAFARIKVNPGGSFNKIYDKLGNYHFLPVEEELPIEEYAIDIFNKEGEVIEKSIFYWRFGSIFVNRTLFEEGDGLKGIAPDAKLYSYKVFGDDEKSGLSSVIIAAIERSVDPNQDGNFSDHLNIISMSLGGYGNSNDPMSQAVDNAVDLGVVTVIAAGNSGPRGDSYCRHSADFTGSSYSICSPGTSRKAITVGASDKNDLIASFSSRGPTTIGTIKPDITAPGVDICAARKARIWPDLECINNDHIALSGTSMATPHISGAAALLKQTHPEWTPDQIKSSLLLMSKDIGENIFKQGWGRLDVLSSMNPPIHIIPTTLEISGNEDNSKSFVIKSAQENNIGVRIITPDSVRKVETEESFPIGIEVSENDFCLSFQESSNISLNFSGINNLEVEDYYGNLEIQTFKGCNFSNYSSSFDLFFSISKKNKLHVEINSPIYFSESEVKNHKVFIRRPNCTKFVFPSQEGFDYYTEDGFFDVILITRVLGNITNAEWREIYMIKGANFSEVEEIHLVFNQEDATLIRTNVEEILESNNMHPYQIKTTYYSDNDLSYYYTDNGIMFTIFAGCLKQINFLNSTHETETAGFYGGATEEQSYPMGANVVNIAHHLENPLYFDYNIFLSIASKEDGKNLFDTKKIFMTPLDLKFPFNNQEILISELQTTNVTYYKPFIEKDNMTFLFGTYPPQKRVVGGDFLYWKDVTLPHSKEITSRRGFDNVFSTTYGIVYYDNRNDYVSEELVRGGPYWAEESMPEKIDFFKGPFSLEISIFDPEDPFASAERYKGKVLWGVLKDSYEKSFILLGTKQGSISVTLPNGSIIGYQGSPWSTFNILGDCEPNNTNCHPLGEYIFNWEINELFINQENLSLNKIFYYNGSHFLIDLSQNLTCGDANSDGNVNLLDATYLIKYLYKGGPAPLIIGSGDVNGDSEGPNILDLAYLARYLNGTNPAPDPLESADVNGDGIVDQADYDYLYDYLYQGGPAPVNINLGDIDGSGSVNILDVTYLINYLYKGGPAPVSHPGVCEFPFGEPGQQSMTEQEIYDYLAEAQASSKQPEPTQPIEIQTQEIEEKEIIETPQIQEQTIEVPEVTEPEIKEPEISTTESKEIIEAERIMRSPSEPSLWERIKAFFGF